MVINIHKIAGNGERRVAMSTKSVGAGRLFWAWVILGFVAGCAHYGDRLPGGKTALSRDDLANAEYLSEFASTGKARLKDGVYREKAAPGSAAEVVIMLYDQYALGDLDGDEVEDAAVILLVDSGGSGTFYYLCAVLNEDGAPLNEATLYLGDRIKIRSLSVRGGRIEIDMLVQGPGDPMVKPTREVHQTYYLTGKQLVRSSQ
jgi:hypothetical protein